MKTIYKYPLTKLTPYIKIEMPLDAKILCFQMQGLMPTIWAFVETNNKISTRYFTINNTGWDMTSDQVDCYVGTIQVDGFVWHLFEVAAAVKSREPKKQATTFPDNFTVSAAVIDLAFDKGWGFPHDHLDAFRDYHLARGSRFVDWSRAFMSWLRKADEFKRDGRQVKETPADKLRQRTKETLTRGLDDKENL